MQGAFASTASHCPMVTVFHNRQPPSGAPEDSVALGVLMTGFLGADEITEIRYKLSGRQLPWDYQSYPKALRALKNTGLRVDWVDFAYLKPRESWHSGSAENIPMRAGLADHESTRLVIPIQTSENVVHAAWNREGDPAERRFPTGALCYVDARRVHGVRNMDQRIMSIHLIADVKGSEDLRKLVRAAAAEGASTAAVR